MSSLGLLETENEEKIKKKANKYVSFDQFKTKFAHLGVSQKNLKKINFEFLFFEGISNLLEFFIIFRVPVIFWKWKLCHARPVNFANFLDLDS